MPRVRKKVRKVKVKKEEQVEANLLRAKVLDQVEILTSLDDYSDDSLDLEGFLNEVNENGNKDAVKSLKTNFASGEDYIHATEIVSAKKSQLSSKSKVNIPKLPNEAKEYNDAMQKSTSYEFFKEKMKEEAVINEETTDSVKQKSFLSLLKVNSLKNFVEDAMPNSASKSLLVHDYQYTSFMSMSSNSAASTNTLGDSPMRFDLDEE